MKISCNFDSGNIEVVSAKTPEDIRLNIRVDNGSHFYQWFHYRLTGAKGKKCKTKILNAGKAAYPNGFKNYGVCASYDRDFWFRIPAKFDGKVLSFDHTPEFSSVYYAYFAPYSMERVLDLVAAVGQSDRVETRIMGETLDGQDLDLLVIGNKKKKPRLKFWVTARQHPGETMASWWMEGFLERLVDEDDPVVKKLLDEVRFYVVPNINPDGSKRGHLRTNAIGVNLNREWNKSSMEKSPEVFLTLKNMRKEGMNFHLDVHGDEALPYNFLIGIEGIPKLTREQTRLYNAFNDIMCAVSPDFQKEKGYAKEKPGESDLSIASNYISNEFGILSTTLEMPFKDNANLPDPVQGWSPERCIHLGRAFVDGLWALSKEIKKR